jgi:hypothetical protein
LKNIIQVVLLNVNLKVFAPFHGSRKWVCHNENDL